MKSHPMIPIASVAKVRLVIPLGVALCFTGSNLVNAQTPAENLLNLERPIVIGHRGYPTMAPENTLAGFELAKLAGADMVELDYHMSADGEAIVIHDATLDRTTDAVRAWGREQIAVAETSARLMKSLDAGSWYDTRFAGLSLPTLDEALDTIQRDGGITLIERKAGEAGHIVELLATRKLVNQVVLQSFDWEFLAAAHALEPSQVLGERELTPFWIDEALKAGVRVIGWNRYVSPEAIAYAHAKGLKVWIYTINDFDEALRLLAMGVDGIITDNTGLVWKAVAIKGRES